MRVLMARSIVVLFQSTPSGGKATYSPSAWRGTKEFQSTPSGGKATRVSASFFQPQTVSIHAFRGEGDRVPLLYNHPLLRFNPRLPGGRRPAVADTPESAEHVSIHAFRGEGDGVAARCVGAHLGFNPRLPGGRRRSTPGASAGTRAFQSTPSGGKATLFHSANAQFQTFQSTPSGGKATCTGVRIGGYHGQFQSTPSGGKATPVIGHRAVVVIVSIHAFRGEGDRVKTVEILLFRSFNPRLPGGRRPGVDVLVCVKQ